MHNQQRDQSLRLRKIGTEKPRARESGEDDNRDRDRHAGVENSFAPLGHKSGPYALNISLKENRLVLDIRREDGRPVIAHLLSLTPFKRIVKDYFLICDSYYSAIRTATPDRIEAIDMGRRGLHDEGSRILQDAIKSKVTVDFDTARRLFTLLCVLHWKG